MGLIGDFAGEGVENSFNAVTPDMNNPVEMTEALTTAMNPGSTLTEGPQQVYEEVQETEQQVEEQNQEVVEENRQEFEETGDESMTEFYDDLGPVGDVQEDRAEEAGYTEEDLDNMTVEEAAEQVDTPTDGDVIDQDIWDEAGLETGTEDPGVVLDTDQEVEDVGEDVQDSVDETVDNTTNTVTDAVPDMGQLKKIGLALLAVAVGAVTLYALSLLKPVFEIFSSVIGD